MALARQALKQRREQQGWTQEGIARALGVETSTWRSWERGAKTPLPGRRRRIAELLDVTLAEVDRYLDAGDVAMNGHAVPSWLGHLASLEQAATEVWAFETTTVHGLLQTPDYAAAVERADAEPKSEAGIARRVDARVARQAALDRQPVPLRLSVVLDESVLYRVAGDAEVMAGQLDHLAQVAERPNVDLRVLPLDAGVFVFGSFAVLSADAGPYMAVTEDRSGAHYLDRDHEREAHVALFRYLTDVALDPASSVDLIYRTAKETPACPARP